MGPPSSDRPLGNPRSERSRRTHHSVSTPSVHPPFPQRAQLDVTPIQLRTHLLGEQHLSPDRFLSGPSSRPHLCNSRPRRSDRLVPATCPSFISGTGKCASESDDSPGPSCHVPGPALPGRSGQAPGPTCPRGRHGTGASPQHPKIRAADWGLPRDGRSPLQSDGDIALSQWSLPASIQQGFCRTPYFWGQRRE